MLSSMFNRRKAHRKITNFAAGVGVTMKRAPSPPSPASFVSPEVFDINEKASLGAPAQNGIGNPNGMFSASRASTPRVQLDLEHHSMNISDWFPQDLLRSSEMRSPPERNASLPGGNGSSHDHGTASSSRNVSRTREIAPPSPIDDVIIIGSTRVEPEHPQPEADQHIHTNAVAPEAERPAEKSIPTPPRKPFPLKIPNPPASAKAPVQRSAIPSSGVCPSSSLAVPGSNVSTRPPTPVSAYTDEVSSAISGTTLARALVANSFIFTADARASRYRAGVTRQDSAILPRGHPFHAHSPSGVSSPERPSSVPPVPPLPSAEVLDSLDSASRARRNSVSGVGEFERQESAEMVLSPGGLVLSASLRGHKEHCTVLAPPISPITEASSPAPSAPNTPVVIEDAPNRSNRPSQPPPSLNASVHTREETGDAKATPPSPVSEQHPPQHQRASTEPPPASSFSSESGPSGRTAHRKSKFMLDLTVEGATFLQPQPQPRSHTSTTGSTFSTNSFDKASTFSTASTSVKSSKSPPAATRARSDSGTRTFPAQFRPLVLLPIGERPHSVQVPHSPVSSPVSTRTSSDTDLRARMYLGGGVPVPVSARHLGETPVDSPDLLDFMFPVAPPPLTRQRSASSRLAPLAISPPTDSVTTLGLGSASVESLVAGSASRQTFPETPYAFSPLWSAALPPPPPLVRPGMPLPRSGSVNRGGIVDKARRGHLTPLLRSSSFGGTPPRHPPLSTADSMRSRSSLDSERSSSDHDSADHAHEAQRLSRIEETRSPSVHSSHSPSPAPSSARASRTLTGSTSVLTKEGSSETSASSLHGSSAPPSRNRSPLPPIPVPAARTPPSTPLPQLPLQGIESPLASPPPSYVHSEEQPPAVPPPEVRLQPDAPDHMPRHFALPIPVTATGRMSVSNLLPQKRALSPLPSPPPSAVPLAPSPEPRTQMQQALDPQAPPPPYDDMRRSTPPASPPSRLPAVFVASNRAVTPDLATPTSMAKRMPRTRPPLPLGPRKPSNAASASLFSGRSRNGSVSSTTNLSIHRHPLRMPSATTLSASLPRFQTSPAKFKGLTMEQAQWTFTSQQLQEVVSSAIKQTVEPSAIRLLPLDTLSHGLADEMQRLEELSAELKNDYRQTARRRKMLVSALPSVADGHEPLDAPAMARTLEELSDLNETLDQLADELYHTTDQLSQLTVLREVHKSSALAMALRKLNTKVVQQIAETQKLREQVAALEAERDDAWKQAQEIAQEFDDMADKTAEQTAAPAREESMSRRSSRVLVARKNSTRRAGLRSSLHARSHRSSASDGRNSVVVSPASRSATAEDIPPVPPLPIRMSLGIVTDVPTGHSTAGLMSDSVSSELRALTEAQRELCEMLGISLEELRPSRPQSMSVFEGNGVVSPRKRRNSEVLLSKQRTPGSGAQTTFRIS